MRSISPSERFFEALFQAIDDAFFAVVFGSVVRLLA